MRLVRALDAEGRVLLANAEAAQAFGFDTAEIAGRPIEGLIPEAGPYLRRLFDAAASDTRVQASGGREAILVTLDKMRDAKLQAERTAEAMSGRRSSKAEGTPGGIPGTCSARGAGASLKSEGDWPISTAMAFSYWARWTPTAIAWASVARTWVSAAHAPEQRTAEARARAGMAWERAAQQARAAGLDDLAVDALHMLAFVETEPATQRQRTEVALAVAQASRQPAAQRWQASLYNNLGMAWHEAGRDDLALVPFEQALRLREAQGEAGPTRVARWMVAWCLRLQGRADEALARQQALAEEGEAAADPDPYVYEELELLYRARGDTAQADAAARRRQALNP